jgi:hypothetical protein
VLRQYLLAGCFLKGCHKRSERFAADDDFVPVARYGPVTIDGRLRRLKQVRRGSDKARVGA